jgi:hypothetical protein
VLLLRAYVELWRCGAIATAVQLYGLDLIQLLWQASNLVVGCLTICYAAALLCTRRRSSAVRYLGEAICLAKDGPREAACRLQLPKIDYVFANSYA